MDEIRFAEAHFYIFKTMKSMSEKPRGDCLERSAITLCVCDVFVFYYFSVSGCTMHVKIYYSKDMNTIIEYNPYDNLGYFTFVIFFT